MQTLGNPEHIQSSRKRSESSFLFQKPFFFPFFLLSMASKTHPLSLRLGLHQKHESLWTGKEGFGSLLAQDRGLRFQIEAYLKALQCIPGPSIIRRGSNGVRIDTLYTKNTLFEDTRPKNRRKNRERGRLPRQNKASNQIHSQGFSFSAQRIKTFWAHTLFRRSQEGSLLAHVGRSHRELATLLLFGQGSVQDHRSLQSLQSSSSLISRVRILSALSCLADAEQGRMSLGYRATQTALHPALADRKESKLRRIVTPSSTLSATHLFGYGKVQKTANLSLSTESFHLQGLLTLGKNLHTPYLQSLKNRFQWIQKHMRTSLQKPLVFHGLKPLENTGLETLSGSTWKGLNPSLSEKTTLLQRTSFFFPPQKESSQNPVRKTKGSGVLGRPFGRLSGGPSLRIFLQGLEAYSGQRVDLRFHKAKDLLAHPDLLSKGIALAFEHRISPRAITGRLGTLYTKTQPSLSQEGFKGQIGSDSLLSNRILGLRLRVSGPLGKQGGGKKQTIVKKFGSTPLSTLSAQIGYSQSLAYTKRGTVGVKVWIHTAPTKNTTEKNPFFKSLESKVDSSLWTSFPSSHFVSHQRIFCRFFFLKRKVF